MTALPVPERLGGDGVGLPEVATVLTEVGCRGAITPALATLGFAVLPLLELASEEQQDRFLAGVARGGVLTAALNEPGTPLPDRPATTFADGRLSGTKVGVGYAAQADWVIVTADSAVVVVSPKADGVQVVQTPTSNGSDEYTVSFTGVAVADSDVLAGATAARVNQLALAAVGAYADGLVSGALRLTADYVANRKQFGKPLSTFRPWPRSSPRSTSPRAPSIWWPSRWCGGLSEAGMSITTWACWDTGWRRRRPRRCSSATTCTAAWAWTSPIRCIGTTPRSRT